MREKRGVDRSPDESVSLSRLLSGSDVSIAALPPVKASSLEQRLKGLLRDEKLTIQSGLFDIPADNGGGELHISYHVTDDGTALYFLDPEMETAGSGALFGFTDPATGRETSTLGVFLSPGMTCHFGEYSFQLPIHLGPHEEYLAERSSLSRLGSSISASGTVSRAVHGASLFGEFAASTHIGFGRCRRNEDGFLKIDTYRAANSRQEQSSRTVLLVTDGLGGAGGGAIACATVTNAVGDALAAGMSVSESFQCGGAALQREHERYVEAADVLDTTNTAQMGVCLVAAEIDAVSARFFHMGDCKATVLRYRRPDATIQVVFETRSHGPAQNAIDQNRCLPHQVHLLPDLHVVHNCLQLNNGVLGSVDVEESPAITLEQGDWVVLASDGLWDNLGLDPRAVAAVIAECQTAEQALVQLHQRVRDQVEFVTAKDDNLTIVVYRHLASLLHPESD